MAIERSYDVVIVGGGMAGLTAGLFAARHGLSSLVVEASAPGGHLINVEKIEDFPGFPEGVAGYDLCPMIQEQAANNGAEFDLAEAQVLTKVDNAWQVETTNGEVRSRVVILAAGARPTSLDVPGEDRFAGRGISHCATCDGPIFRGKVVGVVGGGDSALQEALTLATFASRVIVFERSPQLTGQEVYRQRLANRANVEVRPNTIVAEILGDSSVSGVRTLATSDARDEHFSLAGLFVYVGSRPNTNLLGHLLELDAGGHVPTDIWMRSELPGLFAVGDVRQSAAGQAITAAGDGATAALAARRYFDGEAWPTHLVMP